MTFYEKVKSLCEQQGISVTKLVSDLGLSKSAGTTWKTLKGFPRPGTIKKVADYFGLSIDELKDGIDYIDYENFDTSDFNTDAYEHLIQIHGGNIKEAIKAYLEFEKATAEDAMREPRPLVQNYANNIRNSKVIQGENAFVQDRTAVGLTANEKELLRLFSGLGVLNQARVLAYVAELKEKETGE